MHRPVRKRSKYPNHGRKTKKNILRKCVGEAALKAARGLPKKGDAGAPTVYKKLLEREPR